MSRARDAKILGALGSILILVGVVVFPLLAIVGFILVLVAVKYISDETKDPNIFRNFLISFVFNVASLFIAGILLFTALVAIFSFGRPSPLYAGGAFLGALLAFWVLIVIGAVFLYMSYKSISIKTNVNLFKITGILWLVGAVTTIVFVGFVISAIALLLQIVSFFLLPDKIEAPVATTTT